MEIIRLTRPLSHKLCKMVDSVVQWSKFGHSTTVNNKGYKAHKETGIVSYFSLRPQVD